jgi:hypothetical protein
MASRSDLVDVFGGVLGLDEVVPATQGSCFASSTARGGSGSFKERKLGKKPIFAFSASPSCLGQSLAATVRNSEVSSLNVVG